MAQLDRRRELIVPIAYKAVETLHDLPRADDISLILVTDGKASVILNGHAMTLFAPCILCLSSHDELQVMENSRLFAQSFHLHPEYLKSRFTFRQIKQGNAIHAQEEYTRDMLMLFFMRNEYYHGAIDLPLQVYLKVFEWLCIIGSEIHAQSDGCWTCRVRRYFLQILNCLDELFEGRGKENEMPKEGSCADVVMEYIHANYMNDIKLETLCFAAHRNRTTLNKAFKERTGQTAIEYLLNYRLRLARELLAHTGLTIDEIAQATGFVYGTYLIRQFKSKMGQTPTQYRQDVREKHGIIILPNA